MYKNLETLKISYSNFILDNLISDQPHAASYNTKDNILKVSELKFVNHECFHMASSYNINGNIFTGFCQIKNGKTSLGVGLNEGYTELLVNRYFNKTANDCYKNEIKYAELLEMIIGKNNMEKYYFKAKLNLLVKELEQYEDYNSILKFIENLDYIYINRNKKSNIYHNKILLFLLNCYIKKIVILKNKNIIEQQKSEMLIENFVSKLMNSDCNETDKKYIKKILTNSFHTDFTKVL